MSHASTCSSFLKYCFSIPVKKNKWDSCEAKQIICIVDFCLKLHLTNNVQTNFHPFFLGGELCFTYNSISQKSRKVSVKSQVSAKHWAEEDEQGRHLQGLLYFIIYKCISGLPSFLWPRFPLTRNKPVVGHASTVITREVGRALVEQGFGRPHDLSSEDIF